MKRLWLDIETRSRVDLKKFGVYRYVTCPDFKILMTGWTTDPEQEVQSILTEEEIWDIPGLWDPNVIKVAHNSTFERVCFSTFAGFLTGHYLPVEHWHDPQAVAAEYGYPKSLANLGRALDGERKDEAGTRLINLFTKPVSTGKRKGLWNGPETHPEQWLEFIDYMEQDVRTLVDVDLRLGDHITPVEKRIFLVDQKINDRGLAIDVPMAQAAEAAAERNTLALMERSIQLTGLENPNSVQQIGRWLKEQGLDAPNMRKETVEDLLGTDLTPVQREVLEARQELALAATKKFSAALKTEVGGRLRGTLAHFGAHTGRWAGRGTQPQNLPSLAFGLDEEEQAFYEMLLDLDPASAEKYKTERIEETTESVIMALMDEQPVTQDDLKRCVRPLFVGPLTVVDYSSIEARVIAWLAGEWWALEAFQAKRDIYVETAQRMSTPTHPLTRKEGKVAVLALGYQGAINSLRAMGAQGNDAHLKRLVQQWRKANSKIVRFWAELEDAFANTGKAGRLTLTESEDAMGRAVHMHLPSGRAVSYHNVKWERFKVTDPETGRTKTKEGWRYADPKHPFQPGWRIQTYGGRLAENATQAVARDIMAEALVRLDERGYKVVGHVHDEILVEGRHDVEEIAAIMCEIPDWAKGLPVDGEGFNCNRYRKD